MRIRYVKEYDRYVSDTGIVFVKKADMLNECNTSGKRYRQLSINGKTVYVHRLVAMAFLANPNNLPTVDHINRDRMDNSVDNLRWCSWSDNERNKHFEYTVGSRNYNRIRKYRNGKWSEGMIYHRCQDGKRRFHMPGECPCLNLVTNS